MAKRTVRDLHIVGARVLVRVDFNVPIEQGIEGLASYDHRLRAALPTIQYLLDRGSRAILCSHLGRPNGEVKDGLRMAPVADRLAVLLDRPVRCVADCLGQQVDSAVAAMVPGDVLMLENLRFHPGEEANDPEFARALASVAEAFVMDAFGVAHRKHASTVGVPRYLPSAAGLLVEREVEQLGRALASSAGPLAALLGGAKAADKILLLENLMDSIHRLIIGGGMAVTFLRAMGHCVGASRVEEDLLDFARQILDRARARGVALHLPIDVVVSPEFSASPPEVRTVPVEKVPEGWYIMDIGDRTVEDFSQALQGSKTVIWNGPMGVFEFQPFSTGTRKIAQVLASLEATTVVGGGSTAEAVEEVGLMDKMTHVSTGGGASLEFLEGKELPGIAALPDA